MKNSIWQLQEAKNRFRHVVDLVVSSGAQTVTKHGNPAVVIISAAEYESIRKPKRTLFAALRDCSEDLEGILVERSREKVRSV